MFENVAEHLDEAVRLAERCPEKYQIPCFQALIRVLAQSDSLPADIAPSVSRPSASLSEASASPSNGSYSQRGPVGAAAV